ncbi:MAG: hypothetical protein IPH57_17010 [Saprospiraceae bacterium]|nr:hypothetical protein [Saprospiraceae bacterium]
MVKTKKGKALNDFSGDFEQDTKTEVNTETVSEQKLQTSHKSTSHSFSFLRIADKGKDYIFQFLMLFLPSQQDFLLKINADNI